jgi:superfamily I DNA/RNA helicase
MVGRHVRSQAGLWAGLLHLHSTWREERIIRQKALELLDSLGVPERLRFDAILIDEGQDFSVEYLEVIRRLVRAKQDPEVVIAYDPAQRIYSRTPGADVEGSWLASSRLAKLREGVRLPSALAAAATAFAQRWQLATAPIPARPEGLLPESGGAWWCQADTDVEAGLAALEILARWKLEEGFRAGRCAILVPSKQFGCALVRLLNESGISVNHVFPVRSGDGLLDSVMDDAGDKADWLVSQQRKRAFSYDDSRVKVSTIHSFKGWDAERVIQILPRTATPDRLALAVTYVGITRSDAYAVFVGGRDGFGLSQLGLPHLQLEAPRESAKLRFDELLRFAESAPGTKGRRPTVASASEPPWPTDWRVGREDQPDE